MQSATHFLTSAAADADRATADKAPAVAAVCGGAPGLAGGAQALSVWSAALARHRLLALEVAGAGAGFVHNLLVQAGAGGRAPVLVGRAHAFLGAGITGHCASTLVHSPGARNGAARGGCVRDGLGRAADGQRGAVCACGSRGWGYVVGASPENECTPPPTHTHTLICSGGCSPVVQPHVLLPALHVMSPAHSLVSGQPALGQQASPGAPASAVSGARHSSRASHQCWPAVGHVHVLVVALHVMVPLHSSVPRQHSVVAKGRVGGPMGPRWSRPASSHFRAEWRGSRSGIWGLGQGLFTNCQEMVGIPTVGLPVSFPIPRSPRDGKETQNLSWEHPAPVPPAASGSAACSRPSRPSHPSRDEWEGCRRQREALVSRQAIPSFPSFPFFPPPAAGSKPSVWVLG